MSRPVSELTIDRGAHALSGHLVRPTAGDVSGRGLLFVHGLWSDQRGYLERADAVAAEGTTCLTLDLAGHGASTGDRDDLTLRLHFEDVLAAYDLLAGVEGVGPGRIGICAASYGAYLAAGLTCHRTVKRLLLRAPALYRDADFDSSLRDLRSSSSAADAAFFLAGLRRYPGDVMVVESERDEIIPNATIEVYVAAFRSVVHEIIPDATHALVEPDWRSAFLAKIVSWFAAL